jgi:hypothetical protein
MPRARGRPKFFVVLSPRLAPQEPARALEVVCPVPDWLRHLLGSPARASPARGLLAFPPPGILQRLIPPSFAHYKIESKSEWSPTTGPWFWSRTTACNVPPIRRPGLN